MKLVATRWSIMPWWALQALNYAKGLSQWRKRKNRIESRRWFPQIACWTLSLSLSLVWTVRKQSLRIQFVSWLIGYCKQTNLINCRWNCAFQFLSKTSIIPSEIVDFISTALHVLLVLSLLFLREDIDGELTVRTCDFLQSNIWKKWREKQLHYFRRSRESSPHWSNHAVASGFVYNRCTLAGTHAPYFEVGVCLAPYLRDTVNDELHDFLHRKTFNFVR